MKTSSIKSTKNQHLLLQLMDVLWILHSLNPENPTLAPVVVPGLKHTEQVVHALVEIVHAFNSCDTYSNITIAVYLQLLLCEDTTIAFSAKQALCRVLKPKCRRRRVFIPSPPRCSSPPPSKFVRSNFVLFSCVVNILIQKLFLTGCVILLAILLYMYFEF